MLAYNLSEGFANFYNRYPAAFLRGAFALVTAILPCSLCEALVIFAPILLVFIVIYANKYYTKTWRDVGKFLVITLSVASLFFTTFALNFGAGYHTSSVDKLLELDRRDVSAEELRDAQAHPERYENLQVRMCGWNVRWNDLSKTLQDAYILRAEGVLQP
jgi:hypothetical protein